MATKGRPPEGRSVDVSYTFDKVPKKESRTGWLAGAVHGVFCHCSGTSKPCVRALCGPNAECAGCRDGLRVAWVGYVPLRRQDGRPVVVAIRDATAAIVDRIHPGSRVTWGRDEGRGESVWILEWAHGQEWRHYYPNLAPNADLTSWLVRLWRVPELAGALAEWFRGEQCQPTVTEALPAPVAPIVPPVVPVPAAPDVAYDALMAAKALDDTLVVLRRRQQMVAAKESSNGKK